MTLPSKNKGDAYFRALYSREPDFRQLASQDAEFGAL